MRHLQYLLRNITPLNIALAIILALLIDYMSAPIFGGGISLKLPEANVAAVAPEEIHTQEQAPSISDYTVIAEQNLFNSGRTIPALVIKEDKPVIPRPEVILYGTLISDELSLAYLEDKKSPQSTPGRGKRQTALKKGDTISGYTIRDIAADKIILVREDDTVIVFLDDPKKLKARDSLSQQAVQQQATAPNRQTETPQKTTAQTAPTTVEKQPATSDAKKTFLDFFKPGG